MQIYSMAISRVCSTPEMEMARVISSLTSQARWSTSAVIVTDAYS